MNVTKTFILTTLRIKTRKYPLHKTKGERRKTEERSKNKQKLKDVEVILYRTTFTNTHK